MSRLAEERTARNWNQAYVARMVDVDRATVSRWEREETHPCSEHRQKLCTLFGRDARELGLDGEPLVPLLHSQDQLAHDPIVCLANLPYTQTNTPFAKLSAMVRSLSEEAMNVPARRAFLKGTLSTIVLLPYLNIRSSSYEVVLHECTVGLAAAQEMYRSKDADDLRFAYDTMCNYCHILDKIAQNSGNLRPRAVKLLAGSSILKMLLGWHCLGDIPAIDLAKKALSLSEQEFKISGDPSLYLSSHSKLAWAYSCKDEIEEALKVADQAVQLMSQYDPKRIPACVLGGTWSTLAVMQARNHLKPDKALGMANEIDPGGDVVAFMNFTRADQIREKAIALYHAGDQCAVVETLKQIIDPETLVLFVPQSERERAEAIKTLADSSLATKERNMEQITHYWVEMVQSARSRQSKSGFGDTKRTLERMKIAFPGEQQILELHEHLSQTA